MTTDPILIINPLLEELAKDPNRARVEQIARELELFQEEAVPLLKKMLRRRRGYVGSNALEVLAIMGDPRAILAMLRFVDREPGWAQHLFEVLVKTIQEKDPETRKKINAQLITYLIKGPKPLSPETFDPDKSERVFHKFIHAVKKVSGVKELDEEATQMVVDLKEQWRRPPDQAYLAEQERERNFAKENIVIKVMETLQAFGGLQDPRTESVLENYLQTNQFGSNLVQSALTALAMKDPALAAFHLNEFVPPGRQPNITTRLVNSKMDTDREIIHFSICVRDSEPNSKDRPYSFKIENGLVFFLVRGEENCKWFIGQAQNKEQAVQTALRYLEKWIPKIDDLDADKFGMANHRGEYTGNARYVELAEMLRKNLDFKHWGFQESYILPKHYPVIIYDNEWCRIRFFSVSGEYPYDHQTTYVRVSYGRLHAPNNKEFMHWNGEKCECWHWDHHFLPFLDRVPPEILAEKFSQSPIVDRYERSEFAKNSAGPIERELGKQAALWEHYGQRLFNLFDLRRPDLWDEYVRYKTEYEKFWAKKMSRSDFSHPKIC